ncbi:NAD(P)-dependent oxidoreductase [Actinocorallia populi]|uniref:NAD(P)-dependent oxidoreductase n=1 Tax=Actinocorallia populi TaxID=2079200 RepID=UPI000D09726A|nr:NAD(P)H-binding protein [Actinocorallia populi]
MQVTVFGATGRIGWLVVERLLADGHGVVAFVHDPGRVRRADPALLPLPGRLTDRAAVAEALRGSGAVISALGPSLRRGGAMDLADGVRVIVTAMRGAGIDRFIGLATPSVADPRDAPHWKRRIRLLMGRAMFPHAVHELTEMVDLVVGSDLDYTLARVVAAVDGPRRGTLRAGFLGRDPIAMSSTRADIADFLVDQLTDRRFSRAMPVVSG